MYVSPNYKTKKALKDALANGVNVDVYQHNDMFGAVIPENGTVNLEGPHYPEPHKWYATGTMENGKLVRVK